MLFNGIAFGGKHECARLLIIIDMLGIMIILWSLL